MIVFIDDEMWNIQAYLDELEQKSKLKNEYMPKHFYYPKEALKFVIDNFHFIKVIVIDLGLDYGDDTVSFEPGGVRFVNETKINSNLSKIPLVILTVSDEDLVRKHIDFEDPSMIIYIGKNQPNRDELLWKSINSAVENSNLKYVNS